MARAGSFNNQQWLQMARKTTFDAGLLANELKLSRRQLERSTQKLFGRSPQAWLDEERLVLATALLREHLSVKMVAFQLGFKQPSHFSRQFKLRYGFSPMAFLARNTSEIPMPNTNGALNV